MPHYTYIPLNSGNKITLNIEVHTKKPTQKAIILQLKIQKKKNKTQMSAHTHTRNPYYLNSHLRMK